MTETHDPLVDQFADSLWLTDVELLSGAEVRRRFPYAAAEEITAGTFRQGLSLIHI